MSIRIRLGDMPRLLRDLVEKILQEETDFTIVAPTEAPDVLLVAGDDVDAATRQALGINPATQVLALKNDAREVASVRLEVQEGDAAEVFPQKLVAVIRAAVAADSAT